MDIDPRELENKLIRFDINICKYKCGYKVYVTRFDPDKNLIHYHHIVNKAIVKSYENINSIFNVEIMPEKERVKWILTYGN